MQDKFVVTATICHSNGSYAIDKFLSNQRQIQELYPASRLIVATAEKDYESQLVGLLSEYGINASVFCYDIRKPEYARDRIWNITRGREAVRDYFLTREKAEYILFLDSDMVFDPSVIDKMLNKIEDCDIVFSGYPLRTAGSGLAGCGCVMLRRRVMEKIKFRCLEFDNGQVIFEDNILEMDAFKHHFRIKRGFFIEVKHYSSANDFKSLAPQPVPLLRRIYNTSVARWFIIRLSIMVRFNIPWYIKRLFSL